MNFYQLFSCMYSMMKKQLMSMTVKGIRTENKLKQSRLDEKFLMHTRSNETKKNPFKCRYLFYAIMSNPPTTIIL